MVEASSVASFVDYREGAYTLGLGGGGGGPTLRNSPPELLSRNGSVEQLPQPEQRTYYHHPRYRT